jgi:hypothetical protein
MAPELYGAARLVSERLGVTQSCEIYQSAATRENAALHLVETPVLLEVQGRLLAGLDAGTRLAVLGHELGHYLAHGPWTPFGRIHLAASKLALLEDADAGVIRAASLLSMAGELTADRFGLLACRDLDAALRLEMMAATGLSGDALTWDTAAYLAQVKDLVEGFLSGGDGPRGVTHPEHGLRAYALALFAETKEYAALAGAGPGKRSLEDVETLIERLFARDDLDLDFDVLDAPPPELHECALAGSVLVALADGELVEDESLAIERIFGPLVPRFRDYLEREAALELFYKTGGVVAAHGPSTLRSLFQLLVHVMMADRQVNPTEAEMILAIGQALGCDGLFEGWLAATLRGLGVTLEPRAGHVPALPLPPRYKEASAALDAFFAGMCRRGGGDTSLRRILHLLGVTRSSDATIAQLLRCAADAGLRLEGEVDASRPDRHLRFAPVVAATKAATVRALGDADRRALVNAVARLRDELISGDGRSPSVRVRETRKGRVFDLATLDRVSTGLGERVLAQLRAGKRASLVTAEEIGRHEGAKRVADELVELDRSNVTRMDETGADDLYLGYPVLTGVVDGYLYRAPLVLHPVDIERDLRGARSFALAMRTDESPIVNQSLLRLVFHKKGFALPEALRSRLDELAEDETQGAEAIVKELSSLGLGAVSLQGTLTPLKNRDEELAVKRDHCEIEECALLGLFPQSSSDLLQDYDALLEELEQPEGDLGKLLGAAVELLPAQLRGQRKERSELAAAPCARPALHADPSQRAVLDEARRTPAMVVDGPPGTGKSQVIANLVVDALARGERVAVVCEKRAALDVVVQRIEQLGLRHALAVVHDVHLDRKALYAQVASRLQSEPAAGFDEMRHTTVEAEATRLESILGERMALRASQPEGTKLTVGQLHAFAAGLEAPDLSGRFDLGRLDDATCDTLEQALAALLPFVDLLRPGSVFHAPDGADPRPSMAGYDRPRLDTVIRSLASAAGLAQGHDALAQASPVPTNHVLAAASLLDAARASRAERSDLVGQQLFTRLLGGAERSGATRSVLNAEEVWTRQRRATLAVGKQIVEEPNPELERHVGLLLAWTGRFLRFFVFAWWGARGFVRRALPLCLPERVGYPLDSTLLECLRDRLAAAHAWKTLRIALADLDLSERLPIDATGADLLVRRLTVMRSTVAALIDGRSLLSDCSAYPTQATLEEMVRWDEAVDQRLSLRDSAVALRQATEQLLPLFPWLGPAPTSTELMSLRDALAREGTRLVEADNRMERAVTLFPDAARLFDALVLARIDTPERLSAAFLRAWALDTLTEASRRQPRLAELPLIPELGPELVLGARLGELEQSRAELHVGRVLAALDGGTVLKAGTAAPRRRRTAAQAVREAMLKEAKKQRRILALRTFVRRFASEGLLDVVPVWLLSPETMTILFPREQLFDCVIFDEASQCTVESGFPVLLRAERVVIAGDDRQMPPTSFFSAKSLDDEGDEDDTVREQRDLLADESLLTLASTRVPRRRLMWHYRCRHESLIAFSNHAMYEGQLLTIPSTASPRSPSALRWHAVPAGQYEEGRNRVEAEEVVNILHELLRREPPPSAGVVTFNLQQRATVLEAIERRRIGDTDFGSRWDKQCAHELLERRPFIKNLESVQGDERDVILFSLGHAPTQRRRRDGSIETYVPARFGPLGQRGGERRLNVAVSRAKSECVVVASFEPAMLALTQSRNAGPLLFKRYLEYAHHLHHGRHAQAERTLALASEGAQISDAARRSLPRRGYVPLATQIALALERRGIASELDVGTSEFRIPLALIDPTDPLRFRLAVLTDEGDPMASSFEQLVHRPLVLRQRGFEIVRVTSPEWLHARERIVGEIERCLG